MSVHFGLLRYFQSILVSFGPFGSFWTTLVHLGPLHPFRFILVHLGPSKITKIKIIIFQCIGIIFLWVHLDIIYFCWKLKNWTLKIENWKHYSKIIFKCVNSVVGSIFNIYFFLNKVLVGPINSVWIMHYVGKFLKRVNSAGWKSRTLRLKKKRKKKKEKSWKRKRSRRGRANADPNAQFMFFPSPSLVNINILVFEWII